MSSSDIVRELAKTIAAKRRLYSGAYAADLDRLCAEHGPGAVLEALQTLERTGSSTTWDAGGHAQRVRAGLAKVVADHRASESEDGERPALPSAWR